MKAHAMWFARRQPRTGTLTTVAAVALLLLALPAKAQTDEVLPPIGGGGGSQFVARCKAGRILNGFELRVGDDVDAIRPLCATGTGPSSVGPLEPYPSKFGGEGGGGDRQLRCPTDAPAILGIDVGYEGKTVVVNHIHLFCGQISATPQRTALPSAVYDGPAYEHDPGLFGGD